MRLFFFLFCFLTPVIADAQTDFSFNENTTPEYHSIIESFQNLAKKHPQAQLQEFGKTDGGFPLYVFIMSENKEFDPGKAKESGKARLMIMNGIHPGEPCGIDASIQWATQLLEDKSLPENGIIAIIPVYNVDGAMMRNSTLRVNQNGPAEYGFRGNAKNLDLNRDFIKADSRNMKEFAKLFHQWDPDVFIDTHTSNGADYQYTMTLLTTQQDKMDPLLATYTYRDFVPAIYRHLENTPFKISPYIQFPGETPEEGIIAFLDLPRYSTGYANLFNTIGFMTEAHMLKSYPDRVMATFETISAIADFTFKNGKLIGELREKAFVRQSELEEFPLSWKPDKDNPDALVFEGYEAVRETSKVTGFQRLRYDTSKPVSTPVEFLNRYSASENISSPEAYIIPQAWTEVIERLEMNGVKMTELERDTLLEVGAYYIKDYSTAKQPYEGHYLHNNVKAELKTQQIQFYKGDKLVEVNQRANKFIVETLEPMAPDAFFAWNFFDSILMQKEYFSDYLFEETAEKLLEEDHNLASGFHLMQKRDSAFKADPMLQLEYIYKNSSHYETTHNRYPVFRLERN